MALGWSEFAFAVVFNFVVALICVIVFCFLRRMPLFFNYYNARRKMSVPFRFRPPRIAEGLLAWISPSLTMPDEKFARIAGFDALALVRFLALCAKIAAVFVAVSVVALLPTNLTSDAVSELMKDEIRYNCAPPPESGGLEAAATEMAEAPAPPRDPRCPSYDVTDFDKVTLANIENGSAKLWVHVGAIYIMVLVTLWLLWGHYRQTINWRILYLSWLRRGDAGHTVYVRDIPGGTAALPVSGDKVMPAALNAVDEVFQDQPEDIYNIDTDIVKPGQAMQAGHKPGPVPIANRTSLGSFVSRPPNTDLDTATQVSKALGDGLSVNQVVTREFQRTFGVDQVEAVAVIRDESKLAPLVTEYNKAKEKVLDLTDGWVGAMRADVKAKDGSRKPIKRKVVKLSKIPGGVAVPGGVGGPSKEAEEAFGKGATEADELKFNMWRMQQLLKDVRTEQEAARDKETKSAFVVMRTRQARAAAATGLLHASSSAWLTEGAPNASEVIWPNAAQPASRRFIGKLASWSIFVALIIFFIPITLALQQIVNLNGYREKDNWADVILDAPLLGGIVQGVMPTLALTIILAVMPMFLKALAAKVEVLPTASAVDFELGRKFYIFQFFVVFIFNVILGAASSGKKEEGNDDLPIVTLYEQLEDDPAMITDWLGTAVPQQSAFFVLFLLTKGILAAAIAFLRAPGAIISAILSKLSSSERAKKRTWARQYVSYGTTIPNESITALIMFTFSFMQPFIGIIALIHFVAVYVFWRHQLLYSKREGVQTGGMFWPVMFDQIYVSLVIFILAAIGVMGVKEAEGAVVLVPLLVVAIVWRIVIGRALARPLKEMSMHTAADLDRNDLGSDWLKDVTPEEADEMKRSHWDHEDTCLDPVPLRYVQPALKVSDEEHERALADAAEASRLADAFNNGAQVDTEALVQTYNSTGPIPTKPGEGDDLDRSARYENV